MLHRGLALRTSFAFLHALSLNLPTTKMQKIKCGLVQEDIVALVHGEATRYKETDFLHVWVAQRLPLFCCFTRDSDLCFIYAWQLENLPKLINRVCLSWLLLTVPTITIYIFSQTTQPNESPSKDKAGFSWAPVATTLIIISTSADIFFQMELSLPSLHSTCFPSFKYWFNIHLFYGNSWNFLSLCESVIYLIHSRFSPPPL